MATAGLARWEPGPRPLSVETVGPGDAARTTEATLSFAGDWSRRLRVWFLGLVAGLGVLLLDLFAHPDLELGPLYSVVIVVLSLSGHRLTVVVGTVLIQIVMLVGTCLWPPGLGLWEHGPSVTLAASFICLVAGLLLHRMSLEARLELAFREQQEAWAEVRVLRGLLRTCAWCKRIQDSEKGWVPIERYIADHSEAGFTHGICPECAAAQGGVHWNEASSGGTRPS